MNTARRVPLFRLRTLIVLIALAACGCWYVTYPTQLAYRFMHAVQAGDNAAAESLYSEAGSAPLHLFGNEEQLRRARFELAPLGPLNWNMLWHPQRNLIMVVPKTDARRLEDIVGTSHYQLWFIPTTSGILFYGWRPMMNPQPGLQTIGGWHGPLPDEP